MVVVDIDIIHGDHLVKPADVDLSVNSDLAFVLPFHEIVHTNPDASAITLKSLMGKLVYQIDHKGGRRLLDALSGQALQLIDDAYATQLALHYYDGSGEPLSATLIESHPPSEIGARRLPIWRIDFDDVWQTSFYISPETGELVTRRHELWRVFDFLWMLHIMDYDERENINNTVLRVVTALALLLVLSGVWHLYFRLNVRAWFRRSS